MNADEEGDREDPLPALVRGRACPARIRAGIHCRDAEDAGKNGRRIIYEEHEKKKGWWRGRMTPSTAFFA